MHVISLSLSLSSRRYDLSSGSSSSSRESSPELPALSKRASSYRSSPSAGAGARGKKPPPDSSPYYSGYNSSEEYDGTRQPYMDIEVCLCERERRDGERGNEGEKREAGDGVWGGGGGEIELLHTN